MLKWFSGEEGEPGSAGPGSPHAAATAAAAAAAAAAGGGTGVTGVTGVTGGAAAVEEMAERLTQTEQLVAQLKEMIREKEAVLRSKDDQLKVEKESSEAKLSKLRLQNKAKVTSLTSQLEELKKQTGSPGTPTHGKKGSEAGGEQANRGKIVLLKKKVEDLEQQLAQRGAELENKSKEVESQRRRGEEMDAMLTEKDRKLADKEAFIVHLQTALGGDQPKVTEEEAEPELQLLVQTLTRKVGESEERCSLLQEQTDSLKELLLTEKEQFRQKEDMYKQNIQTFKDILIQKDNQLSDVGKQHEQELFRLAAKSDASADLEQLLKALKQKLHEKEEVLLGKTQVIDVLQAEVDGRDQQLKELAERLRRLQVERESLESKMEAEKHVMRAQLRDLMEKQRAELQRLTEQQQEQLDQAQQDLRGQLDEMRRAAPPPARREESGGGDMAEEAAAIQRMAELEVKVKQKAEEAGRSEAKFLKMKAWSKSRIRQLEEELKKSQAGGAPPDLTALRSRITALEEEREEILWKVEQYEDLKAEKGTLEAKLVVYEEQQRTLQADLEQFTKRAASQASESGSADDTQSQVLEWQEMVAEAVSARDRAKEEKAAMALRISHMEEEREALESRQQELEEELAQTRGLGQHRAKKPAAPAQRSLQEDFEFDGRDPRTPSESTTPMEGENMGGWWPEYSTPDTGGLRSVVEELELERNQLQEQILNLEDRCQDLEDRLQLQARIETLQVTFDVDEDEQPVWVSQNESEKLQSQLAGVRSQQSREAEKHQLLVSSLNEQLKGLSDTQECLESSLIEKENTLAKTSEKLELISSLRESLSQKETQCKEASDRLLQAEHALDNVSKKCSSSEKLCSEQKAEVADLTQRLSALKEKAQKQEVTVEALQAELDQTNEEMDKLNTAYLEERAQLIHDLQSREREIDSLKDSLSEKDKEIASLSGNMLEYAEQLAALKQELRLKEENLLAVENALSKAEREAMIIRESQNSDQNALDGKMAELVGALRDAEEELVRAREARDAKASEAELLAKQAEDDTKTILELRGEIQKQTASHRSHASEVESQVTALKEQLSSSRQKLQESEARLRDGNAGLERLQQERSELLAQAERLEERVQREEETKEQLEERLSAELRGKSDSVSKLEELLNGADAEKKQLREELEKATEELQLREQEVLQLKETVADALRSESSSADRAERLETELSERLKDVSDAAAEKEALRGEISALESRVYQNEAAAEALRREKEDAALRADELSRVLERSAHSNSEVLLEKTQECDRLKLSLRESEEAAALLREGERRLRAELSENQSRVAEQSAAAAKLRDEAESLRKQIHGGEKALKKVQQQSQKHKDQLNDANEAAKALSSQVRALEERAELRQAELTAKEEQNQKLQQELESSSRSVAELAAEASSLRERKAALETETSEARRTIGELLEEREELRAAADSFKRTLEESELSNSAGLQEKTSECADLSKALAEKREQLQSLQEQVARLETSLEEKEESLAEQSSKMEAQRLQLLQLQDTASMLQEQASVLRAGLADKDAALRQKAEECGVYQSDASLQKSLLAQLQEETASLRERCSDAKREAEQKERALRSATDELQSHKDELSRRNESVLSLSGQLGAMNQAAADTEAEIADLRAAAQKLAEESGALEERRRTEAVDLRDNVEALTEQSGKLKAELQRTAAELCRAQEEAAQLKAARSEAEALGLTVGQKDALIQRLNARLAEQEEQLAQSAGQVSELEASAWKQASESNALKSALREKEQSSLEYQSHSSAAVGNLTSDLQAKDAECGSLKEQISHLEESAAKMSAALQVQTCEVEHLRKALDEKDAALSKSLQEVQRRADEASLFKAQFTESAEFASQLQSRVQSLSAEAERQQQSGRETQSAFSNLQEKYATSLEELQEVRGQLSQRSAELSDLQRSLGVADKEHQAATATAEELSGQISALRQQLEETKDLNSSLSKEKEEALASHQSSVSLLTVELERLKAQHHHVVAQMDALTENLEQREMALHAINSQYASQAKHTSQLVSEMQRLEEQNKKLGKELRLSKEEQQKLLAAARSDNARLQEEVRRAAAEKEELERRHHQAWTSQVQMEQQSSSMSQVMEKVMSEKESLQAQVSAKDEELCRLQENIQKIEQILQDSEKEWLLVLDREKQDKNLLAEQLRSVEHEMKSKDVKVNALKEDLDGLQEKLAKASSAIRQGSDQLSAKELEASASRIQLEKVLVSVQEKDQTNSRLQQAVKAAEQELEKLLARENQASDSPPPPPSLQDMIKLLQASHQSEVEKLQKMHDDAKRRHDEKSQQVALLQEMVERLHAQLGEEAEKVKDAAAKQASLQSQSQAKDEQMSCMSLQIAQQKELLSGLSHQLREKDASVAQVMESASSERVKLADEKASLMARLESSQQEHKACVKRLEEQQSEAEARSSEKLGLMKEIDAARSELAKVSKEKDGAKKKLQAALVLRKDLLKRIEQYENQEVESANDKTAVSLLQEQLQEATKTHEENISVLEKTIVQREGEVLEHKAESERLEELLQAEKRASQSALSEKEARLLEALQTLEEQSAVVLQLQSSAAQKEEASERERNEWLQKVDELQRETKACKDELESSSSAAAAVDLEGELAQVKHEKAMLQKKAQAALLARKETMRKAQESEKKLTQELGELKDDYKALLEQRCQQTNELNAVQLKSDEKVKELEELRRTSLADRDELEALKQLVEERDGTLQDLKMSLAEKESRCHSLSSLEAELENLKHKCEGMSLEMEALTARLHVAEEDLEKAQAEVKEKTEEVEKYQEAIKVSELKTQQEKRALLDDKMSSESVLKERVERSEEKYQVLLEENKSLLEQRHQMKEELGAAVELVSQKSSEVSAIRKTLAETQQLHQELEREGLCQVEEHEKLMQEKENASAVMDELKRELDALSERLAETEKVETPDENLEAKLTERDEALSASRAQVSEKEALIAALELQLQLQIKAHEAAVERTRTEAAELQRSSEDQANQSKVTLLTRKLQAALVSRKELMKENTTLKQEVETLSAKCDAREAENSALESLVLKLNQQNVELETSVSSLNKEKDKLSVEVDGILNDNCSLSAACDSLKLTIENITQDKQAFSCQLESLKDSQTDELSKWKSKHAELKQEYESLLQAYENVSSEMDKMRQLLEGAKRDRQEALRKVHKHEAELEILERRVQETEEENGRIKDGMDIFSEEKQQAIKELEEENQRARKMLTEREENHKAATCELSERNRRLEDQIAKLTQSSEELGEKIHVLQAENTQLAEKLEESASSLEKKHLESGEYSTNMQLKLDEALGLNNSLTAQIEGQKTELGAQLEINDLLQKEKQNLGERMEKIQNDHEAQLGAKDDALKELKDAINRHGQEAISLNEKVRILEDDKLLLQEELENVQEISDKVKNENEYLETVILKNSERIDELTESVAALQKQNEQLGSQLAASEDVSRQVREEKEEEQLKLVREFEEKLKTVQRGNEGSKNVKKELQELLKEKHQEINQLQQNCIKYQEGILDLERSLKTSLSASEHSQLELKKGCKRMSALEEKSNQAEAELQTHKNLLQEAREKIQSVESEREQLALSAAQADKRREDRDARRRSSDEKQRHSYMEKQLALQQQVDEMKLLRDAEGQRANELRQQLDSRDLQINTLRRAAETADAKLSALAATPQGADAAKLWDGLFQKTLHEKDNQLLEQGYVIKRFLEDMRAKDREVNELRVTKSRLERTLGEYSVAAAAQQRQLFVMSAGNAELNDVAELLTVQVKELSAQVEKTERDRNALSRQLADRDDAVSQTQLRLRQAEAASGDSDARLLLLRTRCDKLQADLEKQEGVSLQLKTLLQGKDAEISSLLSCRDGRMSGYLEQLQANHRSQAAVYEDRLTCSRYQREQADKETRGLEAKLKSLQLQVSRAAQEKEQTAAKIDSFKNSMVSLQSERERLTSEYRILEAKSQLGLMGKDGAADGEGGSGARGLKHEIRKLLHQMDDLNSENAMLRAQLVRYREDLNQVLSLKDNQLKGLLKKQQDVIKNLESQKAAAEKQDRASRLELQREEEAGGALKARVSKLEAQLSMQEVDLLALRRERAATDEGRVIGDLQDAVAAKAAECGDLRQKLLAQAGRAGDLEAKLQLLERQTDRKLQDAEDKYNGELDALERRANVMRSEGETAERRVAELAKDLLEAEQRLSEARAQNGSLGRAMAALQDDRDQLIEDFKTLRARYDDELREARAALSGTERRLHDAAADLAMLAGERDVLLRRVGALESKDAAAALTALQGELTAALPLKERELKRLAMENEAYGRQLAAFSRSMASLQNDRDRLLDELGGAKRSAAAAAVASPEGGAPVRAEPGPEREGQETVKKTEQQTQIYQEEVLRRDSERKDGPREVAVKNSEAVRRLEAELQRSVYDIEQRDQYSQQVTTKLHQAVEEKAAVAAQLRAVSQTLRDTQNRCYWLEAQGHGQAQQGSAFAEVAPGAPQERNDDAVIDAEVSRLRERLLRLEQTLADERGRREAAEEALRLCEDRAKSIIGSVSIDMETEEESVSLNQPLITRTVSGGMVTCRRWLRGRSLYLSRLLTSRARSRYFFLAYLLALHMLVVMCLAGAL